MHESHYQMILHETWILRWWYMWDDNEWYTTCTTCFVLPLVFSDFWSFHPANQNTKPSIPFAKLFFSRLAILVHMIFFLPYNQTWSPNSFYFKLFQIINQSLKFLILNYTNKTLKDIEQYVKRKNPFFFLPKHSKWSNTNRQMLQWYKQLDWWRKCRMKFIKKTQTRTIVLNKMTSFTIHSRNHTIWERLKHGTSFFWHFL